jgi:hypothetical protein
LTRKKYLERGRYKNDVKEKTQEREKINNI